MMTAKSTWLSLLAATLLLGGAAQAEPSDELLYRVALDRCVDTLRADLADPETTKIVHTVEYIKKKGAWYQFDIHSEVYDDATEEPVRAKDTRCTAHRWSDETELSG